MVSHLIYLLVPIVNAATLAAGAALALAMVLQWARCELAWRRFKTRLAGLPIFEQRHLIGNHLRTYAYGKDNCNVALEAHKRLGKTFGWMYGIRPAVSTIDLDLIKLIVKDEGQAHINRFTPDTPLSEHDGSMPWAEDGHWRKLRLSFAPALKSSKFKALNVVEEVEMSLGKLLNMIEEKLREGQEGTTEVEADDLVHRFTLSVVFSCFYKQYDLVNFDHRPCHWTETVDDGLAEGQNSLIFKLAPMFPYTRHLIDWAMWHFHPQGVWRRSILKFVEDQAELGREQRRRQQQQLANLGPGEPPNDNASSVGGYKRNMIDYVIDRYLDGKLTRDEYTNTSCFLLNAADKTTADCIVHTLYMIATHPNEQHKLRESIKAEGEDSEYLAWTINESLRLLPPVPIGCSRTIKRDIRLRDGHIVPAGTYVNTSTYAIHRLEEYWGPDATEFRPERWQDTSKFHPFQFIPFGSGSRSCPGREFAMFEMKKLFVSLMTRYRFRARPKSDLYKFDSPIHLYLVPNSPSFITIERL